MLFAVVCPGASKKLLDDPAENQELDANILNEDSNSEKQNKAGPPESKEADSGIDSQENKDDQEEGNAA